MHELMPHHHSLKMIFLIRKKKKNHLGVSPQSIKDFQRTIIMQKLCSLKILFSHQKASPRDHVFTKSHSLKMIFKQAFESFTIVYKGLSEDNNYAKVMLIANFFFSSKGKSKGPCFQKIQIQIYETICNHHILHSIIRNNLFD